MNIHTIVVHYSATFPNQNPSKDEIDRWHRAAGSREFGYHWYIDRLAKLFEGRSEGTLGAHVRGHNSGTIGICWAGGLDPKTGDQVGVWNITPDQEAQLIQLIKDIQKRWPDAKRVVGHKDLVATECPGLPRGGVEEWWARVKDRPVTPPRAPGPKDRPTAVPSLGTLIGNIFRAIFRR